MLAPRVLARQQPAGQRTGQIVFLGDASGPLARIAYANVWQGTVTVHTPGQTVVHRAGFFDWLDHDLRSLDVEVPALPFDFALGWVGYLGYELKAECGGGLVHRSGTPDAAMIFADRGLAVDPNMVVGKATVDPWPAYQVLRAQSPAPFAAWLRFTDLFVLSTSPERSVRVSSDGVVESRPIKGTRPRGLSAEHDRLLRDELPPVKRIVRKT